MTDFTLKKHILKDFKAFGNQHEIEIKPITLIFGPNNAGKSSLLKSFMYVHHLFKYLESNLNEVKIGEGILDYGGIQQIVNHSSETGKFSIGQKIKFNHEVKERYWGFLLNELNIDLEPDESPLIFAQLLGNLNWNIEIDAFSFDHPTITAINLSFTNLKFESLLNRPISKKINSKIPDEVNYSLSQKNKDHPYLIFENISDRADIISTAFNHSYIDKHEIHDLIKSNNDQLLNLIDKMKLSISGSGFFANADVQYEGEELDKSEVSRFIKDVENFIEELFLNPLKQIYSNTYSAGLMHFGPLRKIPDRIVNIKDIEDDVWYKPLIFDKGDEKNESDNLSTREYFNHLLTSDDHLDLDYEFIDEVYRSTYDNRREIWNLALRNIKTGQILSLKDVGTGLSQLLPIVVELINTMDSRDTFIEQPELHLHPGLQSKFGRLLSSTFRPRRNIIMETHSEHIIKSLQLEVTKYHATDGEQGISKDDIAILYVSNVDGEANVREMKLDETGSFTEPWPDDFFELSADLTMERLKSRFKSMN